MTDIVERLRKLADRERPYGSLPDTLDEAATEIERLRARVVELEGQHKGLVLQNAILRQRPDLPVDRIPAAAEIERLRAALHGICLFQGLDDDGCTMQDIARAALEEKLC